MTFKIGDLRLENKATTALAAAPTINRAAQNAILRSKLWKEGMKDIYDTYPMTDTNVKSNPLANFGSFLGGALGAGGAGLINNWLGGSGNQFSGRGSSGTDAWGRDFDDPWATTNNAGLIVNPFGTDSTYGGTTTEWNTDMPVPSSGGNAWYNPFGWGK